ncbi:cyclic-phosphate processing receiver domain-containing protein [Streptomyces sp. NPDC093094]|uniref:cyclic-phosphate processing receiver domain-containing protein n=1 Tax=Streptomyces sp. NPDC093094 TaxID=3366026 RepID=UPI00381FA386
MIVAAGGADVVVLADSEVRARRQEPRQKEDELLAGGNAPSAGSGGRRRPSPARKALIGDITQPCQVVEQLCATALVSRWVHFLQLGLHPAEDGHTTARCRHPAPPFTGHDGRMQQPSPEPAPVILAVDDLRALPRATRLARTSREGVRLLQEHQDIFIDELWLDHDLGGDDSIMPVVTLLEEAAFHGNPFRIGTVYVHSANPIGAETVVRSLSRWKYRVRRAVAR